MLTLEKKAPRFDRLIASDGSAERIACGFAFTEGPIWQGDHLLFSDIPNKRIVKWQRLSEGPEITTFSLGCSNGLTLDHNGRVIIAEHDGRKVSFLENDGSRTSLAACFKGGLLSSPNDLVVKSDGSIYFTDPPYGIYPFSSGNVPENWFEINFPGKEQSCNGVYRLDPQGNMHLLIDDFSLPNGLAFSPDEKTLYIDDSHKKHIRAFDVESDGSLSHGRIFLDMSSSDPGAPDGMKVDIQGNIFCTGPGGVWICQEDGELLGRIILPELPANLAWGEDGSVLFLTARTSVYRLDTLTKGKIQGVL